MTLFFLLILFLNPLFSFADKTSAIPRQSTLLQSQNNQSLTVCVKSYFLLFVLKFYKLLLTYRRASSAGPRTKVIQIRTSTRGTFRTCSPLGAGFSESTAFCPGQPTDCSILFASVSRPGTKSRTLSVLSTGYILYISGNFRCHYAAVIPELQIRRCLVTIRSIHA